MCNITGNTQLTALLGHPVAHSKSPFIHNTAFQHLGMPYAYLAFDIEPDQLQDALKALKTLNAAGFNLTMPLKQTVIPFLDEISPEASLIGAVNTVTLKDGKMAGYNTDGRGYIASLEKHGFRVKGKTVVLAGSGGAARSVALSLMLEGCQRLVLLSRNLPAAREIADMLQQAAPLSKVEVETLSQQHLAEALQGADLLINPMGMGSLSKESIVQDETMLKPTLLVSDLIYHPAKTKLLKQAEKRKCDTLNGLGMLLWQAALAFKLWTGKDMPVEHIKKHL